MNCEHKFPKLTCVNVKSANIIYHIYLTTHAHM